MALGGNGIVAGSTIRTVIDLSTTGTTRAREIAAALAARGITAVDSPVSGGVAGATSGTLALMVACPRATFAALEPMLGHLGRVFHVGEQPGMGQTMKLANNLLAVLRDPACAERMGKAGKRRVFAEFAPQKAGPKWTRTLEQMLGLEAAAAG